MSDDAKITINCGGCGCLVLLFGIAALALGVTQIAHRIAELFA